MIKKIIKSVICTISLLSIMTVAYADVAIEPREKDEFYMRHSLEIKQPVDRSLDTKTGTIRVYDKPEGKLRCIIKTDSIYVEGIYSSGTFDRWCYVDSHASGAIRFLDNKYLYMDGLINGGFVSPNEDDYEEDWNIDNNGNQISWDYPEDYLYGRSDAYSDGYYDGKDACRKSIDNMDDYMDREDSNYLQNDTGDKSEDYYDGYLAGYSYGFTDGYEEYASSIVDKTINGENILSDSIGYRGWIDMDEVEGGYVTTPSVLEIIIVIAIIALIIVFTIVIRCKNKIKRNNQI